MKLLKQGPFKKAKKIVKKVLKPFKKRDFMLKFLTVSMAIAILASSILPYILR